MSLYQKRRELTFCASLTDALETIELGESLTALMCWRFDPNGWPSTPYLILANPTARDIDGGLHGYGAFTLCFERMPA